MLPDLLEESLDGFADEEESDAEPEDEPLSRESLR